MLLLNPFFGLISFYWKWKTDIPILDFPFIENGISPFCFSAFFFLNFLFYFIIILIETWKSVKEIQTNDSNFQVGCIRVMMIIRRQRRRGPQNGFAKYAGNRSNIRTHDVNITNLTKEVLNVRSATMSLAENMSWKFIWRRGIILICLIPLRKGLGLN